MVKVRVFQAGDEHRWDRYVNGHADGTFFHLVSWKHVVETTFGHRSWYLIAEDEEDRMVGVLPLFEIKSLLFGHFVVSTPFAETGGPLTDSDAVTARLLDESDTIAKKTKCHYVEFRNRHGMPDLPTKDLYYNFKKEISSSDDANLKAIPRKSRAMVRKGIKMGLRSEFGNHLLDEFYDILSRNYHRLGTPVFQKRFFVNFLKCCGENARIMVVRTPEGRAASAVLTFYYKNNVIPYYAGSDFRLRHLAPNDFMYWELMRDASWKGCHCFDFGRSKKGTGSFHFKKNWGFEPEPLAYQYHLLDVGEMPDLSPANPKYQRRIEMWRRMPLQATRVAGPMLSKYLV
ncbi:FemAB family XrtA/PEP-CTERM system-associated protein [Desulfoluna spongiiphila]|uniref:FemAB family XrtA/PEP-CTERM system-associated protein n=1 Tax=Desulfoluna spongiiphila TaxID=419481 RepID=UPI00125348A6|nr:FemAB family XrtA/PEP-CTERM system-associated protein [Desulfoluna spongiiphila]VVS93988.1 acyl-coa n-acyltransferase [Desulfoluna spongiiphila]